MEFNLRKTLKALLFSSDQPLTIEKIQILIKKYNHWSQEQALDVVHSEKKADSLIQTYGIFKHVPQLLPASLIRQEIQALEKDLIESEDVYRLSKSPMGYTIVIASEYSDWVRILRKDPKPSKLSQPSLETLAIIAYRQPVTRSEMENIRGVSVDTPIHKLLDLELIYNCGRSDLPGRPHLYGTTDKFLEFCGISSIHELPQSEIIAKDQLDQWMREDGHRDEERQLNLPFY